jgi:hypothetical protein
MMTDAVARIVADDILAHAAERVAAAVTVSPTDDVMDLPHDLAATAARLTLDVEARCHALDMAAEAVSDMLAVD